MRKLICVSGLSKGEEFALAEGVCLMGRGRETHVRVLDMQCSRHHCEIYVKGDFVSIEDLKSRHGTFVNETTVAGRQVLQLGDKVTLGTTVLVLCDEHADRRDLTTHHPSAIAGVEVEEFRNIAGHLMGRKGEHSAGHGHHHRRRAGRGH